MAWNEPPQEHRAVRHMKSRNNGRNVSDCIFAKVPIVPPVCGKAHSGDIELGAKNFSP